MLSAFWIKGRIEVKKLGAHKANLIKRPAFPRVQELSKPMQIRPEKAFSPPFIEKASRKAESELARSQIRMSMRTRGKVRGFRAVCHTPPAHPFLFSGNLLVLQGVSPPAPQPGRPRDRGALGDNAHDEALREVGQGTVAIAGLPPLRAQLHQRPKLPGEPAQAAGVLRV